jgi:hypothetical protein
MSEMIYEEDFGNIILDRSKFNYAVRPTFWKFIIEDLPAFSCDEDKNNEASVQVDAALESFGVLLSLKARQYYSLKTKVLILCKALELSHKSLY